MNEAHLNNSASVPSVTEPTARRTKRGHGISCPHCGSPARVCTSRSLSRLYREQTYQCKNPHCGHVYVAGVEVLRTLSPSAMPHPDVDIPVSGATRGGMQKPVTA